MGVHLSSPVVTLDVDEPLVDETDNGHVCRRLEDLDTLERALGDEAGAVAGLGAPGYFLSLSVGNQRVGLRRRPQAEVWEDWA